LGGDGERDKCEDMDFEQDDGDGGWNEGDGRKLEGRGFGQMKDQRERTAFVTDLCNKAFITKILNFPSLYSSALLQQDLLSSCDLPSPPQATSLKL